MEPATFKRLIGLSLEGGGGTLVEGSPGWTNASRLFRMAEDLEALTGSQEAARQWMMSRNLTLEPMPAVVLREPGGFERVATYVATHVRR